MDDKNDAEIAVNFVLFLFFSQQHVGLEIEFTQQNCKIGELLGSCATIFSFINICSTTRNIMAVIFNVLKEEFERLIETETGYSKAIAGMPRGTPRFQRRRNKKYLYLEYRDGNAVVHDYIGPEGTEKANKILEEVARRRRYEKLLKEAQEALKEVKKALRGKI
jgi:hypothetical protein